MIKILHELFTGSIAAHLAFKGGTLAYFCYELDRYSTDIDLDLLDHQHEQEVMDEMTALLSRIGEIKNYARGTDLHRWIFRYDEKSPNIKIELNKRELTHNHYEIKNIQGTNILCMDTISMTTNKLLALSERRYNRDLYDTYFFRRKHYGYDEQIVQARKGISITKLIKNIIHELPQRYAVNTILADGMGDVLTNKQKNRVKAHLVDESIKLLTLYLQNC